MKLSRTLLLVAAVAALGCSTLEMSTDFNPGTDFSGYRTFDFKEGSKPRDPVARRSVEYAIQTALEGRGLRYAESGGDLDIFVHFVLDTELRFETYGYDTIGWYGWGWGGPTVTTVRAIPIGTLLIDLVDSRSKALLWRGLVKDEISTTLYPEEREKKAIGIARQLFANFPPARKS